MVYIFQNQINMKCGIPKQNRERNIHPGVLCKENTQKNENQNGLYLPELNKYKMRNTKAKLRKKRTPMDSSLNKQISCRNSIVFKHKKTRSHKYP